MISPVGTDWRVPLTSTYGEKFTLATGPILPLDNYPGDATALQVLGRDRPGGRAGRARHSVGCRVQS